MLTSVLLLHVQRDTTFLVDKIQARLFEGHCTPGRSCLRYTAHVFSCQYRTFAICHTLQFTLHTFLHLNSVGTTWSLFYAAIS